MRHYPTDLSAEEEQQARRRLVAMADRFTEDIDLSPEWREAFLTTWRHPYVPAYYPSLEEPCVVCIDPQRRATWLAAVYSDETLVTKVQPLPLARVFRPALGWMYTSSSTLPSLVLGMLDALDVREGHRVLEIGTGSGYHCALLCQRLGSARVTSVDIDPELVDLAGERLAANGYTPTLAVADGADGYPAGAPYDRIISTCAVRSIPGSWLKQAAPGAVILTDVRGLLGGALARLSVDSTGTATGRFLPRWASFMWMRHSVEPDSSGGYTRGTDEPTRSTTDIDPSPLLREGEPLGFVAQWHLPDVHRGPDISEDGQPALRLFAPDGSAATVETEKTNGRYRVAETGPRRLWRAVELLHEFWRTNGQPGFERFGITATADQQHIWLDDPDSPYRWPLTITAAEFQPR